MAKEIPGSEGLHRNQSSESFSPQPEERFKYCNWLKHNKKLLNAGEMKEDRVALFERLLEVGERYRRVNRMLGGSMTPEDIAESLKKAKALLR